MTALAPQRTALVRRSLSDGWTVRAASGPTEVGSAAVLAVVPGVVHLDLMAAGLIPDPYLDDNESLLAWIGLVDWTYETTLEMTADDLSSAERHELVFEGLDTVATIFVNGESVLDVANQHRSYRVDVTERIHVGGNQVTVAFRSPVRYANQQSVVLGIRPRPYPFPFDAIRKSACSFGWDWGITTASSGIWRPASLESWSGARLETVQVDAQPDGDGGTVTLRARVVRGTSDSALSLTVSAVGLTETVEIIPGQHDVTVELRVASVERWWPAGHGEQPLYDVDVELASDASTIDSVSRRVGFRSVRWNTTPDDVGTPFELHVNDRPIFVKGVNWIPDDAFPSRVDRARYRARLEQAKGANLNLIRVWGGGIYESDDFYDLCDELGLLTWQDFLFACAAYSEEEPLRSEVEAEARENVARLAHHASLVLLTGNNENLWGFEDWGWKDRLDGKTWGAWYYFELFPGVIAEIAPHVPYAPGSPFSPGGQHPNAEQHGTMHLWDQWNRLDWPTYRDQRPRFIAEFGWQGPPTWTTLTRSIHDDPLTPESPGMIGHQKAIDGNAKLASGLVPHYRIPDDIETWNWAMQLNQANAVAAALGWFRSNAPHTSGAVVWQLNDCWPVTSWAAIDGDGRAKPLLHAIKNSFAPRVVSVQPSDDGLTATLTNDSDEAWSGTAEFSRRTFGGAVLASAALAVDVPPRSTVTLPVPGEITEAGDVSSELVTVDALGQRGLWWFAEPRASLLSAPHLDVRVTSVDDSTFDVEITSASLVRDLTILIDKVDPEATVDRGLVTLLPGESAVFRVSGISRLDPQDLMAPGVTRSGNELVVTP